MTEERQVRELRRRLGLSQERFARLVGVSWLTVRRWENGLSRPQPMARGRLEELQQQARAAPQRARGIPRQGGIPMTRGARHPEGPIEAGVGGMLKGLSGLLDLVAQMAEEGKEEATRGGEFQALGGKAKGIYGFTVRLGLPGQPVIEQFGNIQQTAAGVAVTETREPLVDVLDEGDHLLVVAELPGVEEGDIRLRAEGDILEVSTSSEARRYWKEVLLPSAVDPSSLRSAYHNGVLEVSLTKSKGQQE